MRRFSAEIATLLLWGLALAVTARALSAAGETLSLVGPVFAICAIGSVVVVRAVRRSAQASPQPR